MGLGLGSHPPWGQGPGPQSHVHKTMLTNIAPIVGCQISWVTIMADPMTSYGSMTSLGGMPVMTDGLLLSMGPSPHRACAISVNLDRGHGGLWLDVDCGSIISWGGVVGTSVFAVACMAVAVDQLSLWAVDRDPLGQAWLLQLWLRTTSQGFWLCGLH